MNTWKAGYLRVHENGNHTANLPTAFQGKFLILSSHYKVSYRDRHQPRDIPMNELVFAIQICKTIPS